MNPNYQNEETILDSSPKTNATPDAETSGAASSHSKNIGVTIAASAISGVAAAGAGVAVGHVVSDILHGDGGDVTPPEDSAEPHNSSIHHIDAHPSENHTHQPAYVEPEPMDDGPMVTDEPLDPDNPDEMEDPDDPGFGLEDPDSDTEDPDDLGVEIEGPDNGNDDEMSSTDWEDTIDIGEPDDLDASDDLSYDDYDSGADDMDDMNDMDDMSDIPDADDGNFFDDLFDDLLN